MKKFFLGIFIGFIITFLGLTLFGLCVSEKNQPKQVKYYDLPEHYGNEASIDVRVMDTMDGYSLCFDENCNSVVIIGDEFYDGKVITINFPRIIGTYQYGDRKLPIIKSMVN